jgi:hypothetical protein
MNIDLLNMMMNKCWNSGRLEMNETLRTRKLNTLGN